MTRHIFTFLGTFVVGALLALVARAAWFEPHANHSGAAASSGGEYAPMVANALTPAATAKFDPHAGHGAKATQDPHAAHGSTEKQAAKTVNTVCPICGMDVDPDLAPAEYKGQLVGFGCKACPSKFKNNPEKWGPYALRNEVREN